MKLKSLLYFFAVILLFSCSKELSYEDGAGGGSGNTATYAFYDGTGNCISLVINGSYEKGTALTAANTVTLSVDVAVVGTWSVATSAVNGISFSGSGSFTTTGIQTITLSGSGTPTTEGTFSYKPGSNGCTFSINVTATGGQSGSDPYYEASIDGVSYKQAATFVNGYEAGSGLGGLDEVVVYASITNRTQPLPAGKTEFEVGKGLLKNYLNSTDAEFRSFFAAGTYPYAATGSNEGIVVSWTDETGTIWSSVNAPGTQNGSTFTIVSVTDEPTVTNILYIRVTATFNCTLYDEAGHSKTVTNGKFVGIFGKI